MTEMFWEVLYDVPGSGLVIPLFTICTMLSIPASSFFSLFVSFLSLFMIIAFVLFVSDETRLCLYYLSDCTADF